MTASERLELARMNFERLRDHISRLEESYKATGSYGFRSVRGGLRELGVDGDHTDDVIALIGSNGFDYCMDQTWAHRDGTFPPVFACEWGIDQLRSRLNCVNVPKGDA